MSIPSSTTRLRAPAKINLLLEVVDRRTDGYHEIDSIFVPLDLADEIELSCTGGPPGEIRIESDEPSVPVDRRNTVWRAVEWFYDDRPRPALGIRLHKRIPSGAGLGGGSSDAATVLRALAQFERRELHPAAGAAIATRVGADVPFFLQDHAARVRGIGERVEPLPDLIWPDWLVVAWPGAAVSSRWAYEELDRTLTWPRPADRIRRFLSETRDPREIHNDFEAIVGRRHPRILELKQGLLSLGAQAAGMSGSGSAVFGAFPEPWAAVEAERALRGRVSWVVTTRRLQGDRERGNNPPSDGR